jgi:N-acetylglucosaminyl-diphospho-decaprenol L-rhamnosyltransferase
MCPPAARPLAHQGLRHLENVSRVHQNDIELLVRRSNSPASEPAPDVSIVVVNYNTGYLLDRMFAALGAATASMKIEVVVVDNASTDGSLEILRNRYPFVELIENTTNVGFGRANNQAMLKVRGRYVLLLNTDAFVRSDTLEKTVAFMDNNASCGILGVKLIGGDGTLQPSCRYFPTPWNVFLQRSGLSRFFPNHRLIDDMKWDHESIRPCDWVPGCYYLARSEVIRQVGLFDPRFFLYYEEVDHCRAVRAAGWQVIYYPFTEVVHIGGESAKTDSEITSIGRQISTLQIESELLYFRKYYGVTGLAVGVLLSLSADVLSIFKSLLRRFDMRGATASFDHMSAVLKVLGATGLAAHPTR